MKKLIAFSLALLSAAALFASPVGMQQARLIASRQLGAVESSLQTVYDSRASVSTMAVSAPYYIFNRDDGGFVIVAGDDCLSPVLGYSETGHIDPSRLPVNLRAWLDGISSAVRFARSNGLETPAAAARLWASSPSLRAAGKLLDFPTWYQEYPYNWFCPIISYDMSRSLTGCVATAMSMLMRYHNWPPCGTGTVPGYHMYYEGTRYQGYFYIPEIELGHEYKWTLMPTGDISSSSTSATPSEGARQIAWLMRDCGFMVQASYSKDGTGAVSQLIPSRMNGYMHYKGSVYVARDNYQGDWVELMKGQIDRGLPVIYGANEESGGGHQFIVCGYDGAGKLYVNWGWGGDSDGYFDVDYFVTSDGYSFTLDHDAVINIEPDRSVTPVPVAMDEPSTLRPEESDGPEYTEPEGIYLQAAEDDDGTVYFGIQPVSSRITEGSSFSMDVGLIVNPTSSRYSGYFRLDQYDWQDNFAGTLGYYKSGGKTAKIVLAPSYGYSRIKGLECSAPITWRLGDKIRLYTSKTEDAAVWNLVEWSEDGYTVGEYPLIPMYFIDPSNHSRVINGTAPYVEINFTDTPDATRAELLLEDGSTEIILLEKE